ncbi:MAG: prolyl oligopeptidase family serine peptidase, partial [Alistipes sp.]
LYNKAFSFKYPKAGGANSVVEVWLYDIASGTRTHIDTGTERNQYIPHIGWTPDGRLYFYRLNRQQNHFEVVLCNADGTQRVIYDERSPKYIDRTTASTITFLDADRFVVREETSKGQMHLYLYSVTKGLLHPITQGAWNVTDLVAVTGKKIYYLSTETSPLRRNLYSIGMDGKNKRRLTTGEGFYAIAPSQGMKYYISTFSNASTPNQIEVCTGEGKHVRTLADNAELRGELAKENRPVKEFFTFTTERGDVLNAWMMRPRNFDPTKRYPVLMTQYSGPGSQQVLDRWSLDWEDAVVDAGYIVVCADGRGTGFRNEEFKKRTYGKLGALEVEDQFSTARYMAAQPYVDAARIGIFGWSYGGFMALNCAMKSNGLFKMVIAVAPVTSWRYYDSIYTELYNNLPQENPTGYDDNSPIHFAKQFDDTKTRLLIIHGTADDNVHFQNTIEMTRALNYEEKSYDMMIYADQNHSMLPTDTRNVRQKMVDYTLEHL